MMSGLREVRVKPSILGHLAAAALLGACSSGQPVTVVPTPGSPRIQSFAPAAATIFVPTTGRWSAGPTLDPAFPAATVTLLTNGRVLVFGGEDAGGFPQAAAELFE